MSSPIVPAVPRGIEGIVREDPTTVVVSLDCGHDRHVRHRPPQSEHPWVLDDADVRARIGQPLECFACGQRSLPPGAVAYRSTPVFDEHTVPAGLRREHSTRVGVWARLWVEQGQLQVDFAPPLSMQVQGRPGQPVVIPPTIGHLVRLAGPARFRVEFLRREPPGG